MDRYDILRDNIENGDATREETLEFIRLVREELMKRHFTSIEDLFAGIVDVIALIVERM